MTRVRSGSCGGLVRSPWGGGRGQDPRAAALSPSLEPDPPPCPSAHPRPRHARDTLGPGPGPPRPAPPCSTSGLRSVQGPGRLPRPISLPRSLRGLSPRRAGWPRGARGGGEPGRPGRRRRPSPQPAAPPPRARLRSSAATAATAAGPHNGSGRAVTHPAPAGPAPTRGPPQHPTCPPAPSPGAPRIAGGGGTAFQSHNPQIPSPALLLASSPLPSRALEATPPNTEAPPTSGTEFKRRGRRPPPPAVQPRTRGFCCQAPPNI